MQIYEEVTPAEQAAEQVEKVYSRKSGRRSIVLVQAFLCLLILLAALLLKYLLPGLYADLRTKYDAEMQRSILISHDAVSDS